MPFLTSTKSIVVLMPIIIFEGHIKRVDDCVFYIKQAPPAQLISSIPAVLSSVSDN